MRTNDGGPRPDRLRGERGEGVISAAITVLIMALLGAAMWVTFDQVWNDTRDGIVEQTGQIGQTNVAPGVGGTTAP